MGYGDWYEKHASLHREVVSRLVARGYSQDEMIAYFDFENMVEAEPDFCPLYAEKKKCHDVETLNCFLCACPYFRFNDDSMGTMDGKPQFSTCSINSKNGKLGTFGDKVHQDCSGCVVPHKPSFVAKHFDLDWKVPMAECDVGNNEKETLKEDG